MKKIILLSLTLCSVVSCTNEKRQQASVKPDILASNIDTTVSPAADFFDYANGGWIKKNSIPGDLAAWGIANLVIEENLKRLKEIANKALALNAA
ncbi:MAG: M13 family peptidase, partial [Bacteroidia bacterium]